MKKRHISHILLLCILCTATSYGQYAFSYNDIVRKNKIDTANITPKEKKHSPVTAGWMSAVLPGLGQGYNHKYWKIPIVYAGFGATGFCIYYFNKQFTELRTEYRHRLNDETDQFLPKYADMSVSNIQLLKETQQKNMEISIIVLVVWYAVNIVDAVVDAHLFTFDVSDNLSLHVRPDISPVRPNFKQSLTLPNLSLTLNF
ncbi:MAG: hypothetical protein J5701_05405 [Bacteroidales bacterium]|nr:hypothetical protein [Bacteroidales bacterium]